MSYPLENSLDCVVIAQIIKTLGNNTKIIASLSMMLIFLLPLSYLGQSVPVEAQTTTCTKASIPMNNIKANGDDGNIPQNTNDNNLNTRWSHLFQPGVGTWIQYDLGSTKTICYVDIAWYRGNLRRI